MSDPLEKYEEETAPMTYGEFLEFMETTEDRYEYIEGELYMMASPVDIHQRSVLRLGTQLMMQLEGKPCEPWIAPFDVRFPLKKDVPLEELKDSTQLRIYQPDIFVVCDKSKNKGTHIEGAPDFIIEVLSPGSRSHDMIEKLDFYRKQEVREYWMVDPDKKEVNITRLMIEDGKPWYKITTLPAEGTMKVESIGVSINFDQVFA